MGLIERLERGVDTNQPPDATDRVMSEAAAEIARLRDENQQLMEQIALRHPSVVERDMQLVMESNNKLRAALEEIVNNGDRGIHVPEPYDIARKALAKEGK